MDELFSLLEYKQYRRLREALQAVSDGEILSCWSRFSPMGHLILFKLMEAGRAVQFFRILPFESRYFLLGGLPLGALGPVLHSMPNEEAQEIFHQLDEEQAEELFRSMEPSSIPG